MRLAAAVATPALLLAVAAKADPPSTQAPSTSASAENEVTVTARRRAVIQREVHSFVQGMTTQSYEQSLKTWRDPVCPLVAGMVSDQAEFMLERLSQIARTAHAPLASEHCRPNLYIIATAEPEKLAKLWLAKYPRAFTRGSAAQIDRFVDTPRPARVWRNAILADSQGMTLRAGAVEALGDPMQLGSAPTEHFADPTRLRWNTVLALDAVVVIIDSKRAAGLGMSQLADYVAMVGLTDVDLDARVREAPTILDLFEAPAPGAAAPQGLTEWDRAYLEALYGTPQTSRQQREEIARRMLRDVAP